MHKIIHAKSYIHANIHAHSLIQCHSHTSLTHTPSHSLVFSSSSHTRTHTHTHTHLNWVMHSHETYIHAYLHATHHTHETHVISLNSSHLCSYIHFFIFIYPSPICFFIKLLTCGVIRSYNFDSHVVCARQQQLPNSFISNWFCMWMVWEFCGEERLFSGLAFVDDWNAFATYANAC